jgi:cytochrome c-type biogenesis protein
MLDVSLGGAVLAGLLSFISPCVLPIVPPYLAYLAGLSFEELQGDQRTAAAGRRVLAAALGFVLGFTTVFVALGATASVIGQALARYFDTFAVIAGVVIIVMGLHFLGLTRIGWLSRDVRVQVRRKPVGVLGAYVMGLAFAFGWTPCVGPVLAAPCCSPATPSASASRLCSPPPSPALSWPGPPGSAVTCAPWK